MFFGTACFVAGDIRGCLFWRLRHCFFFKRFATGCRRVARFRQSFLLVLILFLTDFEKLGCAKRGGFFEVRVVFLFAFARWLLFGKKKPGAGETLGLREWLFWRLLAFPSSQPRVRPRHPFLFPSSSSLCIPHFEHHGDRPPVPLPSLQT